MKAIVTAKFGDISTLELKTNWRKPTPNTAEVLVKVDYAAVNPIDWKTRKGIGWAAQQITQKLPWIIGYDLFGTVVATGENVNHLKIGERVCGTAAMLKHGGSYAEYAVAESEALALVPDGVTHEQAAALPLAGLTAWQALDIGQCSVGKRTLIIGGAGGVGHLACQLAIARNAPTDATASSQNQAFLREFGANPIDYQKQTLPNEYYDCIIDLIGGQTGKNALAALKPNGVLVTVPTITADDVINFAKTVAKRAVGMVRSSNNVQLNSMLKMLASKAIKIHISQRFALNEIAAAHTYSENGHTCGKIGVKVTH